MSSAPSAAIHNNARGVSQRSSKRDRPRRSRERHPRQLGQAPYFGWKQTGLEIMQPIRVVLITLFACRWPARSPRRRTLTRSE